MGRPPAGEHPPGLGENPVFGREGLTTYEAGGTSYELRVVHGAQMAPLVPLFVEAFRRHDFNLDWLIGKYRGEFGGVQGCSCVAFADGVAASAFGVLPWPIRFGDRVEVAAQLVDVCTSPAHRRRGLFTALGRMAEEHCRQAGVAFLFAFPQPDGQSYSRFLRHLDYRHVGDLVEYRWPVVTPWIERVAKQAAPTRRAYAAYAQRTLTARAPVDDSLQNSLLREGFAATDRQPDFYRYKAFDGSRIVDLEGGRAWLKVRHGLMVGDLEARTDADLQRTSRALRRLATRLGAHQIVIQTARDTRLSRFFDTRCRALPCVTVVHRSLGSQIPAAKLRFSFGDLDNF